LGDDSREADLAVLLAESHVEFEIEDDGSELEIELTW